MTIGLIAGLLLALGILIFFRSSAKPPAPEKKKRSTSTRSNLSQATHQWHAVRLRAGHDCCDSISYVQEKVYLADEAPTLPLSSCQQVSCRCTYEHFADRRQELRRDPYSQYGLMAAQHKGEERRGRSRGRRQADLASA